MSAALAAGAADAADVPGAGGLPVGGVPILSGRGLGRTFRSQRGTTTALDGVSLDVHPGRGIGVVGESGAGKSTLLRLLLGLDRPDTGEVRYRGEPLRRRDKAQLRGFRTDVQPVFQDPRSSLDPRMRVADVVAEPLRSLRIPGDHPARVAELLVLVGLDADAGERYPAEFSGGQRQRIAIARALAPSPAVLVADEPVSALDVTVRRQIITLLAGLRQELGMALVMVSHDMAIVGQLCEDVVVMRDGRVVEAGPTARVFTRPEHPYTRQLLAAVPQLPDA
ncbi:ABC transporter ATP-binding protein [Georgenia faecalis]|uniref:ABC transporter ATP-binding protein n=1 Tax=Georgenia faecalis TaxID=2483799 RepID=UPI000FD6EA8D|nr:ABC transporter ATP-binding protein [Georgenia faecalis]